MDEEPQLAPLTVPPSLEALDSEGRIEAMVAWFFENFEDPAYETPYDGREGGYQYIWGGPHEAADYIYDQFRKPPKRSIPKRSNASMPMAPIGPLRVTECYRQMRTLMSAPPPHWKSGSRRSQGNSMFSLDMLVRCLPCSKRVPV